ncbi:hypothetical protein PISMIDRAFT_17811 [Pisolithus microcarpus 441]|uniref:Uncharacterized protein n=1 Tax=Pisolithus microcarpus 441 TaxID=765257 RepID=A0A0C9YTR6_9AGAM|nr:hypothetical protein BKA83DRAFT_17811 [Pisolithus microcarpus]KIK13687.1 hypothetical protein PISMIDRAFT_17811 [Pisolithus microcarpus 441]
MTTPVESTTNRLTTCCDRLMASGLYLGDSTLPTRLHWVPEGRGHVLVYRPHMGDGNPHDPEIAKPLDDESVPISSQSPDHSFSPPPEPAELCAIVRIDRDHFWLTSDGGYLGPNDICKEFLDVKPSCALSSPGLEPMASDFLTVLQMLRLLMEKCVTPGYSSGKSFFSTKMNGPPRFKLRHQLFERIDTGLANDDELGDPSTSTGLFSCASAPYSG